MKKTFVLDTNVLIHDPEALLQFEDNDVVLPIAVIEELDSLKKGHGEISVSARRSLRLIDSLRTNEERLSAGAPLPKGGSLKVVIDRQMRSHNVSADDRIISVAENLNSSESMVLPVVLISKDTSVRIKAETLGLTVNDYTSDKSTLFQTYGKVLKEDNYTNGISSVRYQVCGDSIYRLCGSEETLKTEKIRRQRQIMGLAPKNIEQECAVDALFSDKINFVAMTGRAGTGKTLLSLAAGLHLCMRTKKQQETEYARSYEQVVVGRPIVPMGNDIGYLPGTVEEKLLPWMQPVYDNLDVIVNTSPEYKDETYISYKSSEYLVDNGIITIEPLTYIRGRSLPRRYLIIDEAQNLRPLEIKTIITRCGEGTKIVFTGDLEQIDNPFLNATTNGLAYLINRFINEEDFCYLNLSIGARSKMAERAAMLL